MNKNKHLFEGAIDEDGNIVANHTGMKEKFSDNPEPKPPKLKIIKTSQPEPKTEKNNNTVLVLMVLVVVALLLWYMYENWETIQQKFKSNG